MRELYNPEHKMMFIDSLPQYENDRVKKNYENLFYSISKYEKQLNKDFCEMNVPETKMVIVSMGLLSMSSLSTINSLLRDYNNWCIANGKTNSENTLLKIQVNDFNLSFSIQNKLLKSPEELDNILTVAFKEEDSIFRKQSQLIAWLLYYGFSVSEIKNLTHSGIEDIKKRIPNELNDSKYLYIILDLIKECESTHEAKVFIETKNIERYYPLADSIYIIRSKQDLRSDPNATVSDTIILNRIKDINSKYSCNTGIMIELTIDRIINSGIFYKLYKYQKEKGTVESKIIRKFFNIDYRNPLTINNEVSKKRKDYENWKKAFEL